MDAAQARSTATLDPQGNLVVITGEGIHDVWWAGSCGESECECTDIVLYPIVERSTAPERIQRFEELRVEAQSARIFDEAGEELETGSDPALQALGQALTGEVLDALVRRWHEDKGAPLVEGRRARPLDVDDWSLGAFLAWEQVFHPIRFDAFVIGGTTYRPIELYDPNPARDLSEVLIEFYAEPADDADLDEEGEPMGSVAVHLEGQVQLDPEEGRGALLDELWAAYQRRYPTRQRLRERHDLMKKVGADLLAGRRSR